MNNPFEFKSLDEFFDYFKDEETCRKYFVGKRFGAGAYCPHCGHTRVYEFAGGKRYRCEKCKQDFTIRTKTVFGESKLPLRKWFAAIYLLSTTSKGISSVNLAKQIGVTQKTAWFMDHRIREVMKYRRRKQAGRTVRSIGNVSVVGQHGQCAVAQIRHDHIHQVKAVQIRGGGDAVRTVADCDRAPIHEVERVGR